MSPGQLDHLESHHKHNVVHKNNSLAHMAAAPELSLQGTLALSKDNLLECQG